MIPFQCPACGKTHSVKDEMAGRQARCACGTLVQVPQPAALRSSAVSKPVPPSGPTIVAGESSVIKAEINASQNIGQLAGDMVQNKTISTTNNISITNKESILSALTGSARKEVEAIEREFAEASKTAETLIAFITKQIAAIESSSASETGSPVFKSRYATGMQAVALLQTKSGSNETLFAKADGLKRELTRAFGKVRASSGARNLYIAAAILLAAGIVGGYALLGTGASKTRDDAQKTAQSPGEPAHSAKPGNGSDASTATKVMNQTDQNAGQSSRQGKRGMQKADSTKPAAPVVSNRRGLFNGKDLSGWKKTNVKYTKNPREDIWKADVANQLLVSMGNDWMDLRTTEDYLDFQLELAWRFTPGSTPSPNGSGIMVRANGLDTMGSNPRGIEVDLRPNDSETNGMIMGRGSFIAYETGLANHTGTIDGKSKRNLGLLKSISYPQEGQWTNCRILCFKDTIEVYMNDTLVNKGWGQEQTSGQIVLRSQNSAVQFKDITLSDVR